MFMKKMLLGFILCAMGVITFAAQPVSSSKLKKGRPVQSTVLTDAKQTKAFQQSVALSKFAVSRKDVKVISSTKKGNINLEIVQTQDGVFHKRITHLRNENKLPLNKNSSPVSLRAGETNTLFESFEDWDESDTWLPAGWSLESKEGNAAGDDPSLVWHSSYAYQILGVTPTDGNVLEWISIAIPEEDTPIPVQDEWLISKAFTPKQNDLLLFDLYYAPFWFFLDMFTFEFDFENPLANIQVMISIDNGAKWDVLWDASIGDYNEDNIWDLTDETWETVNISLSDYVGKSVKIAFRYTAKEGAGNSVALDNIIVDDVPPIALYRRPQGFFYSGLSIDYSSFLADQMIGPAYVDAKWTNLSKYANTYSWIFPNQKENGSDLKFSNEDVTIKYPYGSYEMPTLNAKGATQTSSYQWGTSEDGRYFRSGGYMMAFSSESDEDGFVIGAGNFDLTKKIILPQFNEGDYCYGTSLNDEDEHANIDAIANYFEKPLHKYVLDGLWISAGEATAPAGFEFKLTIRRVVDGFLSDTIATAVCKIEDVVKVEEEYYSLPFTEFIVIDPEIGLEITEDYLEIEDAIFIELTGFNGKPNVSFGAFSQALNTAPGGESNAFVYLFLENVDGEIERKLLNSSDYLVRGATSLLFNLDLAYSFILTSDGDEKFAAPNAGGNKTFDIISFFSPDEWEYELPDWISDDIKFDEEKWDIKWTLTAKPLPNNLSGRTAYIKVSIPGSDFTIVVTQGNETANSAPAQMFKSKVINTGNSFELSYPAGQFSAVSIINMAGQQVANYSLPSTGTFSVPVSSLAKGVYLVRFYGKSNEVIKVIH